MCQYKRTTSHTLFTICFALTSALLSIDPVFRLQVFWFECFLRENGLAIITMTTFKVSTGALHLLAIACIMLVVVQVTVAARELENSVGGVLVNREQVASVHTKAGRTFFQAAACELLRLPCAVQSSIDANCFASGHSCYWPQDCCSRQCIPAFIAGFPYCV
jgi:hypothetical protein